MKQFSLQTLPFIILAFLTTFQVKSQCIPTQPTAINNCSIGPASLQLGASSSTGFYNWYDAAIGGNLIGTGSTFQTPLLASTTNYYVASFSPVYALQFDGTNDYVALNMNYNTAGQIPLITVEAWVKTSFVGSSYTDNWAIVDFDRSEYFNLYVRGDNGEVGFSTTDNTPSTDDFYSGVSVNDGNWHHIAAVYDGADKIIYVDGVEVSRKVNAHGGNNLGTGLTRYGFIGDGSEATTLNGSRNNIYYNGAVDEVRIWNSVRTPSEINTNKGICLTGAEPNLTAYYDFDENTGSILNDRTGNGNNGTLFNFPATPWITGSPIGCANCESNRTIVTSYNFWIRCRFR